MKILVTGGAGFTLSFYPAFEVDWVETTRPDRILSSWGEVTL